MTDKEAEKTEVERLKEKLNDVYGLTTEILMSVIRDLKKENEDLKQKVSELRFDLRMEKDDHQVSETEEKRYKHRYQILIHDLEIRRDEDGNIVSHNPVIRATSASADELRFDVYIPDEEKADESEEEENG